MKSIAPFEYDLTVKTMRLFIVDSSQSLLEGLAMHMDELPGLEIVGDAQNLDEAVAAIRVLTPDVVMMDLDQLGKSGHSLATAVSHDENAPFVMVLSGNEPGFEAGPDILLYKSGSLRSAVAILRNLLKYFHEGDEGFNEGAGPTIH